jgi:hypothetical protein
MTTTMRRTTATTATTATRQGVMERFGLRMMIVGLILSGAGLLPMGGAFLIASNSPLRYSYNYNYYGNDHHNIINTHNKMTCRCSQRIGRLWVESLTNNGGDFSDFGEDDLQVAGIVIEDLSWRVHKLRLEEENKKRFLKAKPRFLPYDECRKWVQAFNRWQNEQDW